MYIFISILLIRHTYLHTYEKIDKIKTKFRKDNKLNCAFHADLENVLFPNDWVEQQFCNKIVKSKTKQNNILLILLEKYKTFVTINNLIIQQADKNACLSTSVR